MQQQCQMKMTMAHSAAHLPGLFAVNSLGPINSFRNTSGIRFWFSKPTVQRPLISIWKSDRAQHHVVKISGAPIQLSLPTYRLAATGRIHSQDFTSNDAFDHEPFWLSLIKDLVWFFSNTYFCRRKLVVEWVPSADLEDGHKRGLETEGCTTTGGFGDREVQGKILVAKYARKNNIPFLGICLGMQIAVIEFARYVLNLEDANSTESDPNTSNPCVVFMPEGSKTHMGGTMRLGSRRTYFQVADCTSAKLYGNVKYVDERHSHRYEVNPAMISELGYQTDGDC